jgi:exosome complex protein LRP1
VIAYLRLHGVNAKEHPVFRELTRVKQYFGKIQALEAEQAEPEQRTMTLDKEAAGRFIKHGLVCISWSFLSFCHNLTLLGRGLTL